MNSNRKGKVGEREIANYIKQQYGIDAKRGQQHKGGADSPDIIVDLDGFHWEIKRVEHLNIDDALMQSTADAKEGEKPIVVHRKNRTKWKVTMWFDDFMDLVNGGDINAR